MPDRLAACSCGQLAAHVSGDPVRVAICHCLACQRRTGSAFGQQARFRREQVVLSGVSSTFVRVGDEGGRIVFHFCPTCGSTVYYQPEGLEAYLAIPVGAFADPGFPAPTLSVYEERKHPWVRLPDGIEHLAERPGPALQAASGGFRRRQAASGGFTGGVRPCRGAARRGPDVP